MVSLRRYRFIPVFAALFWSLGVGSCTSEVAEPDGSCQVETSEELDCSPAVSGTGSAEELGLVKYSCTGTARPDNKPRFIQGVPEGLMCADRGTVGSEGRKGYCCTSYTTPCALDPVADCEAPTFGYQCRGANRPESLNAALACGNGVAEGDLINYCCSGKVQPDGCIQSDAVPCSSRLMGWNCQGNSLPRGEQLGANKSRADYYYMLCPTASPAPNPERKYYCCYNPALVPIGGSCVQHTTVPGCAPGRFGFACYGPETPEEDYLPMDCPEPGFPGRSAQGYPATLYCCDFK